MARVGTDRQEYERQLIELRDYSSRMDWEVVHEFSIKYLERFALRTERREILSLVEYVRLNDVKRVVCHEISRLGRNTLEALKIIQILNENKVSLYVKNYNIETHTSDGKVNPVTSFICTILLEVALMERLTIKDCMASDGIDIYSNAVRRVLRWEDRQAIGKALRIIRRNIKKRLPC